MNVFCTDKCCVWEELCANRPRESAKVAVKQDLASGKYAVVATADLKRGEVLGEYLGRLRYMETDRAKRPRNQGYMFTLRTATEGARSQRVGIDAHQLGGRMRFANHACDANAEFFEFANGSRHTVVVVTTGDIGVGSEVTVNYGTDVLVCVPLQVPEVHPRIHPGPRGSVAVLDFRPRDRPASLPVSSVSTEHGALPISNTAMGKPTGSSNYSVAEMNHMLDIVQRILPQGKDHWDSVTARYNATWSNHWPERDIESLRRKFKALYGMKKPSGNANIPGHVRLAKDVKKLIDEASSVFLASDNEDEIGEGDGGAVDRCEDGNHTSQLRGESDESDIENEDFNLVDLTVNEYVGSADSLLVEEAGDAAETEKTPSKTGQIDGYESSGAVPPFMRSGSDIPCSADLTGLELELAEAASAVAATPSFSASTGVAESGEVTLRRSRRNKPSLVASVPTPKRSFKSRKPAKTSESARPQARMSAEVREKLQYPDLAESSDRLGGVNLAAMRNASNSRTYEEFEEASYSKQKRIKAEKAASDLKRKLDRAAQSSADNGNEL
ncbi:hypothetical protein L915_03581, partial [Phytophthora nicotianae]